MLTLTEINIYPLKSLGGISLDSTFAGERGLKYDRRYLLVDENGEILTCLLYTSDAADERSSVDLDGRRIIKKKKI